MNLDTFNISKFPIKSYIGTEVIIYENGSIYQGNIKNNLPHGYGKFFNKNIDLTIEGQFFKGLIHGYAELTFLQGNLFTYAGGKWINNVFDSCDNVILYRSNIKYVGQTKGYCKQGFGRMNYNCDMVDYIECVWNDNIPIGKINLKFIDNENIVEVSNYTVTYDSLYIEDFSIYDYSIILDIFPEKFTQMLKLPKGVYTGYTSSGLPHLYGSITEEYAEYRIIYEGIWRYGEKHGDVIQDYNIKPGKKPNVILSKIEGSYHLGQKNGAFKFSKISTRPDIIEYNVVYEDDVIIGDAYIIYKNGSSYFGGTNTNFEKHGDGAFFPDGKKTNKTFYIKSNWQNDKLNSTEESMLKIDEYKKTGVLKEIHTKNKTEYILDGPCNIESDTTITNGNFVNGLLDGIVTILDKLTGFISKCLYSKNIMVRLISVEKIVNSEYKIVVKNDRNIYVFNKYRYLGELIDGKKHGIGTMNYDTKLGKIIIKGEWENDNLILCSISTDIFDFEGIVIDFDNVILCGKHIYKNGSIYTGTTKLLMRSGKGKLESGDWDIYCNWKKDIPNNLVKFTNIKTGYNCIEKWK